MSSKDPGVIEVRREGLLSWRWRAWGVLARPQHIGGFRSGGIVVMPTGEPTTVDEGYALTERGARRKARRALARWT